MASCITSTLEASASSAPWAMAEGLLEASIPGFSIFSGLAKTYLRLDLSALISAMLPLAAIIASIRYAYGPLTSYISTYGTSTAEIRSDDEMYNYVMYWVSQQRFSSTNPRFLAGTEYKSELVYYDSIDDQRSGGPNDDVNDWELAEENFDKYWELTTARDKFKSIHFTPCQGTYYFRFKGHWLSFTRETTQPAIPHYNDTKETLYISCLGRNPFVLKELLKESQRMYIEKDSTKTVIHRKESDYDGCNWSRCMARPPRPLSTVVLDQIQKDAILADIREYLHPLTKRWYANRGIPYRRGYLLYGPPGTGKTSLCVALAGTFGLDVYVTSLNSKTLSEENLATLFSYLPDRCVVLLEDVDSAGITHKRDGDSDSTSTSEPKDKIQQAVEQAAGIIGPANAPPSNTTGGISLSGLLNVIDGVASSEGRILIMTTNHVEKLDPALLRPGRVDMSIAFENANEATAEELFKSTYISREEDYPTSKAVDGKDVKKPFPRKFDFEDEEIANLAVKFASQVPPGEFSPADIQGYLLKNKSTPKQAAEGVPEWVVKTRDEKARQRKANASSGKQAETPVLV